MPRAWRSLQRAGNIADAIGGAITLADIRIAQGRLHEAMRTYERGLQLATEQGAGGSRPVLRGAADMHVGLSELHRERDDLHAATQHLLRSEELGEHPGSRNTRIAGASRWRASGRPRAIWTARSTCSTRPSACM